MSNARAARVAKLLQLSCERILVLDGAMGTSIQNYNLSANDFGGATYEGCNEYLVITKPSVIAEIHRSYLQAGADIIETNTFGGTPLVLNEYQLGSHYYEINLAAAKLARVEADALSTLEKPRFVAGSMGPTTKAISVTGGITFNELIQNFYEQAKALYDGGVDYFLIETCQDTRNTKACLLGIDRLFAEVSEKIPIAISITIEPTGTMLAGQSAEAFAASVAHRELLYIGFNCATGPAFMTDSIRSLADFTEFGVACVPNAGLPDEDGNYLETPDMVAQVVSGFAKQGWINFVGGCCGTTPKHIAALVQAVKNITPRKSSVNQKHFLSGIDYLEITDEMRPVIVGERTNVIGSRKFKNLINEEKFEEASEVGRGQVKNGAQIVDVCMANPDRDELSDMRNFLSEAIKKIRVPLMIDSTDEKVLAEALTYCQGKAIINSINLEDGEERFEKVVPLAKQFGAALVVGTIDEDKIQGMGVTRARKLEIAKRSYDLLTQKYGVREEDIYWDPLVFPVGTGDEQYKGSAVETIEGIRLIKQAFPKTCTVLGVSNVSFGLPPAGREVLNSVYLYHCVQAGLDLAIVNSEMLQRYGSLSEEEKRLSEDLLWNRGADPIAAFTEFFRGKNARVKKSVNNLPLEERLALYVVEGTKEGLAADIEAAMKKYSPLEIINGPLMKGMDEVGRLFGKNELIVAEVLQSAEVMKAAVNQLEPFMEKKADAVKGTVLLATVKGDVHDIGKNLVDIILSNNGYRVINLGIKIPSEQIIAAVKEHQPNIIGLSGLLVKSAQQMVLSADDLKQAGIKTPILVGGAALSEKFTDKRISQAYEGNVFYAKDAMKGLELADTLLDDKRLAQLLTLTKERRAKLWSEESEKKAEPVIVSTQRSSTVSILKSVPKPPDLQRHIISTPADEIYNYINPAMLYGRHLGVKGKLAKMMNRKDLTRLAHEDEGGKAREIFEMIEELKQKYQGEVIVPKAVYQFFKAKSLGNEIFIYDAEGKNILAKFNFPREPKPNGLCLADYLLPTSNEEFDSLALFAVTAAASGKLREVAEKLKNAGDYLKSHALQILALESAEAYAECLHAKLRAQWGFADSPTLTMMERFQAKYQGKRYSFGYPACPNLEDQKIIFDLIKPEEIGIELTEGFMMDPEASVSAIVFHHPDATYFGVGS